MPPKDKPKLLFLNQTLPFPPDGGVRIRSFHILRLLATEYEVTALCFYRAGSQADPDAASEPKTAEIERRTQGVKEQGGARHIEAFPVPQEYSTSRLLWDHARSFFGRRSYTTYLFESPAFRARLEALLAEERFNLVYVGSIVLARYISSLAGLPIVCDHHNVESDLLRNRARRESSTLRGWYLSHQASLVERDERTWCPRVDLNLAVSTADRDLLLGQSPSATISVVPNGVDTTAFQPSYDGDDGVLFVGGHTWFPNRDAMEHFAKYILPRLRELVGNVPVRWVGRAPRDEIARYRKRFGIELTGYVEEIGPWLGAAGCFIVPLRVGGGTRLKILDAWAMGKAIVSTSKGCEGLDARDGENILIRDDDAGFAEAVAQVLEDESLRRRLGRAGRAKTEELYDWRRIGRRMLSHFRRIDEPDSPGFRDAVHALPESTAGDG